ncbi:MAG: protein tyrosine phosphatase family protein [Rhodothermales bacterium]|nr:protein tyrosine phosphatase family protein [Rhodothermales bacterium]MBO6779301.1 protein tyrosine phosphatase family protein [Rhodothermales bacterium]
MKRLLFLAMAGLLVLPVRGQSAEEDLATIRNYVKVSDELATSGQIAYDQIASLAELGYDVVVNLATASESANALEGYMVVEAGMTYVHIPVSWGEPSMRDLEMFFDVMEMNEDRKVFVHCFANMRASAFTYLYRTLVQGVSEEEAKKAMDPVWDPMELEQWADLIERAQAEHKTD